MKLFVTICLLCACLFSVAQNSLMDQLHTMQINPRLKEKVYLHTNKTNYFPDDIIWFKAYVGDSINHPSWDTRVLEVRLFDDKGVQLFDNTVAISSGTGKGQIELNDAVAPGTYYLQARTQYMRNFGADYHYLQKITILGQEPYTPIKDQQNLFDVQLLPEGGNLIEEVENVLGIKAMVNGQSVDFHGAILNRSGDTITSFQSEHQGMGKCSFHYDKGETYRAHLKIQDTLMEQVVPVALAKGISLSLDGSDEKYLKIRLKTNKATLDDSMSANYSILYSQDRQLFQLVSVAPLKSTNGLLKVNKNLFLDGVNTLTLFADDRPIAERKFYMETNRRKALVSLEQSKIDQDSITYRLATKGKKKNPKLDLSISILHANSKAVDLQNTITTAFLLSPYVRGKIENPAYYFDTKNEKRKEHLDLLLLTQGWTQYTLEDFIQNINPDEKYAFKRGFELKGTLREEPKYTDLVLIPNDLVIIDKVALDDQSNFTFQDLNVSKGDTIRVAFQDGFGKLIKPGTIVYDTTTVKTTATLTIGKGLGVSEREKGTTHGFDSTKNHATRILKNDTLFGNLEGTIDLEEVIVTDKKLQERYLQRRRTLAKYKPIVSDIGKYYDLPLPEMQNNSSIGLINLLANEGLSVQTADNGQSYIGGMRSLAFLAINGQWIRPEDLPTLQLRLSDIENIMVKTLGSKEIRFGVRRNIKIYQVFTSRSFGQNKNKLFDQFVVRNGFDRAKKYYTPLYSFEESRPLNLLEIDWKPELKTDKNGKISFKVAKDKNTNGLLFIIQGFSTEGHLISETILTD